MRASDAAAQSEAASRVSLLVMLRGKLGEVLWTRSHRPQLYTRSVRGNAVEPLEAEQGESSDVLIGWFQSAT